MMGEMKQFDLSDGRTFTVSANRIIEVIAAGIRKVNDYELPGRIPEVLIEERATNITLDLLAEGLVKL
jgi:hypothetical protein